MANAQPPVVVIKRKKTIAPPGDVDPTEPELQESRTPRVFRVDSPVVGSDTAVTVSAASDQPEAGGASPDVRASVGVGALTAQGVQIKRRRRRIPRAEVTIIRPAVTSGPVVMDPPARREAEMLFQEPKHLEPSFAAATAQEFDLGIETAGRRTPSRYQALQAKIKKLEQRAEALRKVEAAKAARWIKRAIAAYGLRARDLGL